MKAYQLSCPSKTFFIGEYAVLEGAPAVVFNTSPRFKLQLSPKAQTRLRMGRFHPQSPAGRWLRRYSDILGSYRVQFFDPHRGRGGCGASTAQFLMLYAISKFSKQGGLQQVEYSQILKDYLSVSWDGHGIAPSGVDLMGQLLGGITYFHKQAWQAQILDWQFKNLSFLIVRTGFKIPTHAHIQELKSFSANTLAELSHQGLEIFLKQNSEALIQLVKEYGRELNKLGFVAEHTQTLLEHILNWPEVLAAKGCGAMGADMLVLLCRTEHLAYIKEKIKTLKLFCLADEKHLSSGIKLFEEYREIVLI